MHRFVPLASYRYNSRLVSLDKLTSPPATPNPNDIIHDEQAGFYVYQMTYLDESKQPRKVEGIYGILELTPSEFRQSSLDLDAGPGKSIDHILIHEQTINSGACTTNEDAATVVARPGSGPVWAISLTDNIHVSIPTGIDPLSQIEDSHGVIHKIWQITNSESIKSISSEVQASQLIIADGHHRIARAIKRLSTPQTGSSVRLLSYISNLTSLDAEIRPIHRCFKTPLSEDEIFTRLDVKYLLDKLDLRSLSTDNLKYTMVLVYQDAAYAIQPRRPSYSTNDYGEAQSISKILEARSTQYITETSRLLAKVKTDRTKIGIITRPMKINQIRRAALSKTPLPPKSTLFYPKPLSGLIFGEKISL